MASFDLRKLLTIIQSRYNPQTCPSHKPRFSSGLALSVLDEKCKNCSGLPLISVCIPVYNGFLYLGETINSVLSQDYDNLEIIIQDNASTDGTWPMLQSLAAAHPQISIMRNEQNVGMSGNWNLVVNRASGDYVMLLSADDLLEKGFLESCLQKIEQEEVDAVTTNHYWFGKGQKNLCYARIPARIYCNFSSLILLSNPFSINFTLFSKRVVEHLKRRGRFFSINLLSCDYEMWIRFSLSGMRLYYIDKPLGSYRLHEDNLSRHVMRMNRHAAMAVLKNRSGLEKACKFIYRITLIRFAFRVLICMIWYKKLDKRQFSVLLAHLFR